MKIIADCGATCSRWGLIGPDGSRRIFKSKALNAATMTTSEIEDSIGDALSQLAISRETASVEDISGLAEVYAAGCRGESEATLYFILRKLLPDGWEINVGSDMVLSARASLFDLPGIACIMGTGSNSCEWNGRMVSRQIPSLGYILGDEGSGAAIGKHFVSNYLKGLYSYRTTALIAEAFNDLTVDSAIRNVYKCPAPNRWLASFVPFIKAHLEEEDIRRTVETEIDSFFIRNISQYKLNQRKRLGITGGCARAFERIVRERAYLQGFEEIIISGDPLTTLLERS